jgi:hypothetical protein
MVALRTESMGAFSGPLWFSALCAAFTPTSIGYQDLAGFLARQPGVSERWREHPIASAFGTIHVATFTFARPIGTAMPEPLGLQSVNFDPHALDVKAWSLAEPPMTRPALQIEYPTVNRRLKGDRMPSPQSSPAPSEREGLPPLQPIDAPGVKPASPPAPSMGSRPKDAEQIGPATSAAQLDVPIEAFGSLPTASPQNHKLTGAFQLRSTAQDKRNNEERDPDGEDESVVADMPPEIPVAGESDSLETASSPFASLSFVDEDPAERKTQLYFNVAAMGSRGGLEQWEPGAEPVAVSPSIDPDIKLSALRGPADTGAEGETVAGKDGASLFKSPAERLGLTGKARAKAEKCIADAVYFEARGEPLRGQMAVAQVIMNRVFSGYYPNNVCGVVYQNANRHLACQFTFACEGKDLSRVDELDMWEQAKRIAKDALDGNIWLAEVGHATHYHAYWVHPSWVHEMNKMYRLGVHTFYRPRAWGDGSDAPIWSNVPITPQPVGAAVQNPDAAKEPAGATKTPETAAKMPEAALSPAELFDSKTLATTKL